MKNWIQISATVLLGLFLAGCQTLSKDECLVTNSADLGQKDGFAGYNKSRIERHTKACAKAGITPDQTAYFTGYDVGIRQFCTPQNGLRFGRSGGNYENSCPADLHSGFSRPYLAAKSLFSAERALSSAEARVERLTDRAFSPEVGPEERASIRSELGDARREMDRARFDVRRARLDYDELATAL